MESNPFFGLIYGRVEVAEHLCVSIRVQCNPSLFEFEIGHIYTANFLSSM